MTQNKTSFFILNRSCFFWHKNVVQETLLGYIRHIRNFSAAVRAVRLVQNTIGVKLDVSK